MIVVINNDYVELRHGAVLDSFRNKRIGAQVWNVVRGFLKDQDIKEIELYSRNTALMFWQRLGFIEISDWLEHELFIKHGIKFKRMKCKIE